MEEEKENEDDELNLLAMQMQKYQHQPVVSISELWAIWSLVESTCYDLNGRDNRGVPPIVYAAMRGSVILLRLLLNYHADINAVTKIRETAVMAACRKQKIGAVAFLIKRNARLDTIDQSQFSALRWAATHGNVSLVRLLLKHKVSVTQDCYTSNSALTIAMGYSTKKHAKIALILQRQLVCERRQLLQQIIAKKEQDEIKAIRKHRRKMIRLEAARKVNQDQQETVVVTEEVESLERSPFALPIIPSLKKKLPDDNRNKGQAVKALSNQLFAQGGCSPGSPSGVVLNNARSLRDLLQTQFAPPASTWVKVDHGRWQQETARPKGSSGSPTKASQSLKSVTTTSDVSALDLVSGDAKWNTFISPESDDVSNCPVSTKVINNSHLWHVEDIE